MHLTINTKKYGIIGYTIDDEDYKLLEGWKISVIRMQGKYYYIQLYKNGKKQYLHRLIMGNPKGLVIDHINHNTLDNRKCNLRAVSPAENYYNMDEDCEKNRKLTDKDILYILNSEKSNNELSKIFHVSNCMISKVRNKLWYRNKCKEEMPLYSTDLRKERESIKRGKKVLCVETNIIYDSISQASKLLNINWSSISMVCNNKRGRKTAGGFQWKFI